MPLSDRIRPCVLYGDEAATSAFSAESAPGRPGRPPQAGGLPHHRTTQSRKWTAARRAALMALRLQRNAACKPSSNAHSYPGSPVRPAATGSQSRLHGHRAAHAHAGHRRHGGDLQRGRCRAAARAALPRPAAAVARLRTEDAVLLRALPYRDPKRLVSVFEDISQAGFPRNTPAPGNYADWKAQTQIFEDAAAAATGGKWHVFNLTGETGAGAGDPEKLEGASVTQNLFAVLGAKPALGRVFLSEEDRPGGPRVVLISHGLWQRRFAGDPGIVDRAIVLNGEKCTVVGVMPAGFAYPSHDIDLWTPMAFTSQQLTERGANYLQVVARLRAGVTLAQANAGLQVMRRKRHG